MHIHEKYEKENPWLLKSSSIPYSWQNVKSILMQLISRQIPLSNGAQWKPKVYMIIYLLAFETHPQCRQG